MGDKGSRLTRAIPGAGRIICEPRNIAAPETLKQATAKKSTGRRKNEALTEPGNGMQLEMKTAAPIDIIGTQRNEDVSNKRELSWHHKARERTTLNHTLNPRG
jgi:hypothetical protein